MIRRILSWLRPLAAPVAAGVVGGAASYFVQTRAPRVEAWAAARWGRDEDPAAPGGQVIDASARFGAPVSS